MDHSASLPPTRTGTPSPRPSSILIERNSTPGPGGGGGIVIIKRHVMVDSAAILVAAVVTAADVQDRSAFPRLLRQAKRIAPSIHTRLGGQGLHRLNRCRYRRQGQGHRRCRFRAETRPRVHSATTPVGGRTHQRLDQPPPAPRPPSEVTLTAHEGFLILSQIALLLRRLDRSQLFDTL